MTALTVNDTPVDYRASPDLPLLWALRDLSNLTGAKYGCDDGSCGYCIVDVDGRAVRSCQLTIGAAEGAVVTTIEGLSPDRSNAVQQAFVAEGVAQCGYCIPAMVLAANALLAADPSPDAATIRRGVDVLCRCGGAARLVAAVRLAIDVRAGRVRLAAAPAPGVAARDAAREVEALSPNTPPGPAER